MWSVVGGGYCRFDQSAGQLQSDETPSLNNKELGWCVGSVFVLGLA